MALGLFRLIRSSRPTMKIKGLFYLNLALGLVSFIPLTVLLWKQSDRILIEPERLSSIQRKSVESLSELPSRWIVTSRIGNDVSNVPNWIILLYDTGEHNTCRNPHCVTLDDWTPGIVLVNRSRPLLKRRLYGFLYAMSQGATFIASVDTLCSETGRVLSRFIYSGTTSGLVPLIDRSSIQPERFFTRTQSNTNHSGLLYKFRIDEKICPSIQMSFAIPQTSSYVKNMDQLPPVFVPVNTFIPLHSDVMLFRHDAFWALYLDEQTPESFHVIIQKSLWAHGSLIGLFPRSVISGPSFNVTYTHDFSKIVHLLENLRCVSKRTTIVQCLLALFKRCTSCGTIPIGDLNTIQLFLQEMENIGYVLQYAHQELPTPVPRSDTTTSYGIMKPPSANVPENNISALALAKYCPNVTLNYKRKGIEDMGLIITFNQASYYHNLPLLEAMYRPYFTHVLYCGPNITSFTSYIRNSTAGYVIFIDALKKRWLFMYECTVQAMQLNIGVKGFLQIGDDTLVNVWNVYNFPRDRIWLHTGVRTIPITNQDFDWGFWKNGKRKVLGLLSNMRSWLVREGSATTNRFLETFRRNSLNFTHIFVSGCDFMYVPVRLKEDFYTVSSLFTNNKIMLEIGFANMAMLMDTKENIHFAKDGSMWRTNRRRWAEVYNRELAFLHPYKVSSFPQKKEGKRILCEEFFSF